ncbi:hypothetical protein L3Q82_005243 [Scortum barcoo]|uniref:Uncharacterized protein n=1 Tax=Scortum barcoo TaxID=214431 RepID=A0ACB8VAK2_9TELE|nr:hypothetical protein L3Q82_005243 [Scortum barcoo]
MNKQIEEIKRERERQKQLVKMRKQFCPKCDGMMDKGVLEPVGPALGKEQSFTEQAPLVADDGVQRVAGIVHNIQQFVQSPRLCHRHQRVQLRADHRAGPPDQFIQSGCVLFGYAAPPAHHSVKEDTGNHRLVAGVRCPVQFIVQPQPEKSEVYRVKRRGASTVPWGAPVLLTTVSGRDVLQPDVLWSASEMGVGSMEQVVDGILHANTWLVGELQAILGVLHLGSEEAEEEPLLTSSSDVK